MDGDQNKSSKNSAVVVSNIYREGGSTSMLATYLESHAADLGKSLLPLSLRKGLCCLYLLSASTPCLFPSLHTPTQAASQAAHFWKDSGFSPKS